MNTAKTYSSQKGFFDLGIGLALFAIFGTTAYILAPNSEAEEGVQIAPATTETNRNM